MKIFISFHYDKDHKEQEQFVYRVSFYLRKQADVEPYCYTGDSDDEQWREIVGRAVIKCDKFVLFVGREIGNSQKEEVDFFLTEHKNDFGNSATSVEFANACQLSNKYFALRSEISVSQSIRDLSVGTPTDEQEEHFEAEAQRCAREILITFGKQKWIPMDGLPVGYPFGYEKKIIEEFVKGEGRLLKSKYLSEGCPIKWPKIEKMGTPFIDNPIPLEKRGDVRSDESDIIVDVRGRYHSGCGDNRYCLSDKKLTFPEAGPRAMLYYPHHQEELNIGIVVSGGIAPGINAVIDGIFQRHTLYCDNAAGQYRVNIYMYRDGFDGLSRLRTYKLDKSILREQSTLGGSMINTSRYDKLLEIRNRRERENLLTGLVRKLEHNKIDILYVIGGDGSMRAAHALWTRAQEMYHSSNQDRKIDKQISVVAIPKTMDNDVLWVWQSFGFLSAVEKAKEFIVQLNTEAKSNPRLCIVQLFGSDSGFVVSHAALASGACMAALIPEVNFTMQKLSENIRERMRQKYKNRADNGGQSPYGLVLLAETAIPQDVEDYIDNPNYPALGLEESEKEAIRKFMQSSLLCSDDIRNWRRFADEIKNAPASSAGKHLFDLLIPEARGVLERITDSSNENYKSLLIYAINRVLKEEQDNIEEKKIFYKPEYFDDIEFNTELIEMKEILHHVNKMVKTSSASIDGEDIKTLFQRLKSVPISCEAREIVNSFETKSHDGDNWRSLPRQDNLSRLQQVKKRLTEKFNRLLFERMFSDDIIARSSSVQRDRRVHGQTPDELRTGGLKIVSRVLKKDIREIKEDPDGYWHNYRVFVNEPRHLIRAIAPSVSDVIFGQRLGILAVDNAMAGYTDFMVSQWLTEYVMVPLKLAVLGRKRVPPNGIFWKSVLAGTGQAANMI
jgi:6-phosphofructokinase 1